MTHRLALCLLFVWAGAACALDLDLPSSARETMTRNSTPDSYFVPTGLFHDGSLPGVQIEGAVRRSAFRIPGSGLTPLQVLQPLRDQLVAQGFDIVLDCAARRCGGFDFRFATETLPAPAMTIGLRDFHFLTGLEGDPAAPRRAVTLLASTSSGATHLQIIQAGALGDAPDQFTRTADLPRIDPPAANTAPVVETGSLSNGRFLVEGLEFEAGADTLGSGRFEALERLAALLEDSPGLRIVLVGHTDSTGSLDVNIAISRRRAEAVRSRLVSRHGVAPDRVDAQGVGYLAPIADNATEAGRTANRRVEAVLLYP